MIKASGKIVCLAMALALLSVPAWGSTNTDLGTDQLLIFNPVVASGYGWGQDGDGGGEGGGEWGPGDCCEDMYLSSNGSGPFGLGGGEGPYDECMGWGQNCDQG